MEGGGEEGRGAEGDRRRRDPEVRCAACALAPPLPMRTGAVERLEGRCRGEMGSWRLGFVFIPQYFVGLSLFVLYELHLKV